MSKRLTPVALVALLLAVGSVSLASAGSSGPKPADTKSVQVIELVAKNVQVAEFLGEDKQLSVGDQLVLGQDLFRHGTKVGRAGVVCTTVRLEPPHGTQQCVATVSLPKGHLTTHGLVTFTEGEGLEPSTLGVTGGTDAYRTAHGELIVEQISETEQRLTYKLIL